MNKNTPLQALSLLAKDEECDIRCTVAENENVLPKTLLDLVQGEDYNVRQSVAGNFSTPVEKNEMKKITLNEYAIHLYSDSNLSEMEKVKKFAEKQWEENKWIVLIWIQSRNMVLPPFMIFTPDNSKNGEYLLTG